MKSSRIALIGFGDINQRIAEQLLSSGARLHAFSRNIDKITLPISCTALDVSQEIAPALPAFDYVVVTLSPDESSEAGYRKTYIDGLRNILAALDKKRLKKIFWVSSSSVYAQSDSSWVDETSPTLATGFRGQLLLEAEALLNDWQEQACVVRFSGIYRENRHRLATALKAGELAAKVEPDYYSNRIHVADCARVITHLMARHQQGLPLDSLYLASDCEPVLHSELLQWLAQTCDRDLNEELPAIRPKVGSKRCSNTRLLATGFEFLYPSFRQGFLTAINSPT